MHCKFEPVLDAMGCAVAEVRVGSEDEKKYCTLMKPLCYGKTYFVDGEAYLGYLVLQEVCARLQLCMRMPAILAVHTRNRTSLMPLPLWLQWRKKEKKKEEVRKREVSLLPAEEIGRRWRWRLQSRRSIIQYFTL